MCDSMIFGLARRMASLIVSQCKMFQSSRIMKHTFRAIRERCARIKGFHLANSKQVGSRHPNAKRPVPSESANRLVYLLLILCFISMMSSEHLSFMPW
jgi:hypothetical protein